MKHLLLFLFGISLFGVSAHAISPEFVPHLDKAFLVAPSLREDFIEKLSSDVKPFCDLIEKYSPVELNKVKIEALETCRIKEVTHSLEESEKELHIKAGEPFMVRVQRGPFDEAAVWRYFIRMQAVRRLLTSVRVYFSQAAGINQTRVGMIGVPLFAASLDNYSYWTRLIAMKDSSWCPPGDRGFCDLLEPQLVTLAKQSWAATNASDNQVLDEKEKHLMTLANSLRTRLSSLTLDELMQLEKMDNVTSAGLGIPYFCQLLMRLNIKSEDVAPEAQQQIQRVILINEVRDALSRWNLNVDKVDVNSESERQLTQEILMIVTESRRNL